FFGFCRDQQILLCNAITAADVSRLCQQYLLHLREIAGGKHVLIDVKYNSWGAISPAWRHVCQEPYFLHILKNEHSLFVFLQRLDIAEQIISGYIARASDKWQNLSAGDTLRTPMELDIAEVRREAHLICQSEAALWKFLQ